MDLVPCIRQLPEDLVNKIAAGEVVGRPASVVKGLVENALDAGASTVSVEIEAGGKQLIRVRDDGAGMGRDDAVRALDRHATSKIHELSDLHAIATHGFRGEALPSIASVSHLVLRTRADGSPAGTEVEVRHGQRVHVRDAGHPRGTTVEVRDLFGSVPARRKFLRAEATEAGHVAEALTLLALARPGTGFTLASGPRSILRAPAVDGLAARLYQVFGGAFPTTSCRSREGRTGWRFAARVRPDGVLRRPNRACSSTPRPVQVRARPRPFRSVSRAGAGDFRGDAFSSELLHLLDVAASRQDRGPLREARPWGAWSARCGRRFGGARPRRRPAAGGGPRPTRPASRPRSRRSWRARDASPRRRRAGARRLR